LCGEDLLEQPQKYARQNKYERDRARIALVALDSFPVRLNRERV